MLTEPLESESIAENSLLSGLFPLPVAETEVVDEVEEAVVLAVEADELLVSDCCCICISTPRIMLDRLGVVLPVRPPSLAAVVDWVELEDELAELAVELELEVEVDSSRDSRLASIWDALPDEPIPAMDMVVLLLTGPPAICGWAFCQKQAMCQDSLPKTAESGVTQLSGLHS